MSDNQRDDDKTRTHTVLTKGMMVSHYRIIEKIGAGGMGEVFVAEDSKLDRKVALKFLPPHLCQNKEYRARFEREAQATAALNHPNVVTIYEISQFQGQMFIAMELVDGKSLYDIIKSEDIKTDTIIGLAVGLSKGLAKAHEAGIVHRDIKPSNIIVDSDGVAKILDFGLADVQYVEGLTQEGITLGTAGYMSPEQVAGQKVDQRSDLFSLGVVLYELLTGQAPFRRDNIAATLYAVAHDEPKPIAGLRSKTPDGIQSIIDKALRKNAEGRYQTAQEMLADLKSEKNALKMGRLSSGLRKPARKGLRRILPLILIVAILVPLFFVFKKWSKTRSSGIDPMADGIRNQLSIAVLPFDNLSADPEQEYFCDGMTDEIINALAKVPGLRVVARTSSFTFKGKDEDIHEIGRKLNVKMLLDGSVQKSGDRLRITTQLVNVSDGYHLWSEQYNRRIEDIFAIQDSISQAIVDSLKVVIVDKGKAPLVTPHTTNMEAYNLYLRGRYHWNKRSYDGMQKCIDYYHRALGIDSNYALAYAGLADAYIVLGDYGIMDPRDAYNKAKLYTAKALEINPDLTQALVADAFIAFGFDWNWQEAEIKFKNALSQHTNYATGYQWYSEYLAAMGRHDEASVQAAKALELDPLSLIIITSAGVNAYRARQYDVAIDYCQKALELDSTFIVAQYITSLSHLHKESFPEAAKWFQKMEGTDSTGRRMAAEIGDAFEKEGIRGIHQWNIDNIEISGHPYNNPYFLAINYAALGEIDIAFEWLDKAYDLHSHYMVAIKVDPDLDSLRSDPRFDKMLGKMNLD